MSPFVKLFYLSSLFLLAACAQVGTLTGGAKDTIAPRVKTISPKPNSTDFTNKQVSFEFDEFIKLNNPQQNAYLIPADASLNVTLDKKTVTVAWKEDLQPNTTYTLYLNGAVQDTHEGNDSLMTYVFSTGPVIDSISYSVRTVDAWTSKPVGKITVVLYEDSVSNKAKYFGQSDQEGWVKIENLKAGQYFLRAFNDVDKNLAATPGELRGFNAERIILNETKVDSLPVRMFLPENLKIRTFKLLAPGVISIASKSLPETELSVLGQAKDESMFFSLAADSSLLFLPSDTTTSVKLIATRGEQNDTLRLTISKRDHQATLNLKSTLKRACRPSDKIQFEVNDRIISLNSAKIKVIDLMSKDTIDLLNSRFFANRIELEIERKGHSKVDVVFEQGAFSTLHLKSSLPTSVPIELKSDRDLGSIKLKTWKSNEPLLIYVYRDGTFERMEMIPYEQELVLTELEPGIYRFKIVEDVNRNGMWDVGDDTQYVQPESVYDFEGPTVRANWETEVQLSLEGE